MITTKENKSVVYAVEYSYGEIKLLNHHEISFVKYSNGCNKKKMNIFFFSFEALHCHQQTTEYF